MAVLGIAAAGYYFAMRPVTLKVAVGPANSDDLKVVQTLAQGFNNQRNSQIRLRPLPDRQRKRKCPGACRGQGRPRHHPRRPRRAEERASGRHAAQERRRALGAAPGQGQGQEGAAEDHQDRAACRPPHRRDRPHAGQRQSAEGDPQAYGVDTNKVEIIQFPANEAADAIRNQKADAYIAAGPVNSKITTDAIIASSRDGGTPTILAIDLAEAIAQNHPAYEASDIPAGSFGSVPEDEVKTISFAHHIVARRGLPESTVAAFTRQLFSIRQTLKNEFPLAAKIETPDTDKDATIPAHPGAAAFVDGEEKTFLDRYSDFIWWG
jgi:hypothetical protein